MLHDQIETYFTKNKTEMASSPKYVIISVDDVDYRIDVLRNFNLILYRAARRSHGFCNIEK